MVDILLSTYNGEKYLREQLDSLINQSYKDINIIVRDDCSTDNTCDILKEYKDKFPSIFELHLEKENKGCKDSFLNCANIQRTTILCFAIKMMYGWGIKLKIHWNI